MARFRGVGGSWTDPGTPTCNQSEQTLINTALNTIRTTVDNWGLSGTANLVQSLRDMLDCSLEIDCNAPECAGLAGRTPARGEHRVQLCGALTGTQQRLTAVLFHEMIHAAGGTELDAEAFESHFFAGSGATAPTSSDWPLFQSDEGTFVLWDQGTCDLFVKRLVGGSWTEPPTVERGDELTPDFCAPPPPPPPPKARVPDVVGDTAEDAITALTSAGFSASLQGVVDNSCNNIGDVTSQSPHGGFLAPIGSTVTIRIGELPPPPQACP
jgi:hypothetical protein